MKTVGRYSNFCQGKESEDKCQEKDEEDSSDQDLAPAREELLQYLIDKAQKQIGL